MHAILNIDLFKLFGDVVGVCQICRVRAGVSVNWLGGRRSFGLFFATAIAELVDCYLLILWLTRKGTSWLLFPAAMSLTLFVAC